MATRDRHDFMPQALRCFLRQSYPNRELVVVDDGETPVEALCRGQSGVRYLRLTQPTNTGTKLNIGIEEALGDVIQKLDDDDFYHRDFVRLSEARLPRRPAPRTMVAWCCFLVLLRGEPRVRHSGHGWTAGGTLCFQRALWRRTPFRDVPRRVDAWFLFDHKPRLLRVCAPEHYILVRHGENTWRQMEGGGVDEFFQKCAVHQKRVRELVESGDLHFYRRLCEPTF